MKHAVLAFLVGAGFSLILSWILIYIIVPKEYRYFQRMANGDDIQYFAFEKKDKYLAILSQRYSFNIRWSYCQIYDDYEKYINGSFPKYNLNTLDEMPQWSRLRMLAQRESGHGILEVGAGWPLTSWKGEWRTVGLLADGASCWYCLVLPRKDIPFFPLVFPYRPVLPGLFMNAIFWGGIFYIFTTDTKRSVWFFIRRHRRRKGRCPHCAYDITGLTTCPECGQPVASKA